MKYIRATVDIARFGRRVHVLKRSISLLAGLWGRHHAEAELPAFIEPIRAIAGEARQAHNKISCSGVQPCYNLLRRHRCAAPYGPSKIG